jgi:hypothetical protein
VGPDFSHNCILKQKLRRLDIRSMFPPKSPFRALFGAFYPIRPTNPRCERNGLLTAWHPVNVGAPPSPWPLFSRLPPHAAVRRDKRGQAVSRPFPAGYCLMPTPELGKSERSPFSMIGLSPFISMAPNRAIPTEEFIRFSSLAAVGP